MKKFTTLIVDVDGVLSSKNFIYTENGKHAKIFSAHDADAIKFFRYLKYQVVAITADKRGFEISKKRANDLLISINLVREIERSEWIKKNFGFEKTAFVGDGYFDIKSLINSSVSFCPNDALDEVKSCCDFVLSTKGGEGVLFEVLREVIQHLHPELINEFYSGNMKYE